MTATLLQFPDLIKQRQEENPYSDSLPPLLGLPRLEVFERVFEENFEFLGIEENRDAADLAEFFIDNRYPEKILVDLGAMPHNPELRGLYHVDLSTFKLIKINDEPLKHFVHNQ